MKPYLCTSASVVALSVWLAAPAAAQQTLATPSPAEIPAAKPGTETQAPVNDSATGATGLDGPQGTVAEKAGSSADIVVTGSRIQRSGFSAPTPVTVVGVEQLKEQAVTRLVDFSRNIPQFRNQGGAQSGSNGSANGGQGGLNLRGLGANRNLILLDRRRVVPSTGNGIVDANLLPSALIQRIDVVTGGASAAWGSDAVSGVVNFVLDTKFSGFRASVNGGISSHGDNGEFGADAAFGRDIGERAHLIASIELFGNRRQKLLDRGFLARKPGVIDNPAYTATNGQPRRLLVSEGIVTSYMTHGGLIDGCRTATGANIANCALRGTAFGAGGTPYSFVYGTYVSPTGNMIAPAGSDYVNYYTSLYDGINMVNPSKRISGFGHLDYELTDSMTVFAEGMYTKSRIGPSFTVPPYRFGTSATTWLSVTADNAYLPASIKAQMSGPGGGSPTGPYYLNIGRINDDWFGNSKINNTNTTYRGVAGFKGSLGGSWGFDGYYEYGRNTYFATVDGNLITSRNGVTALGNINLAVDAVAAPAGNAAGIAAGTIVCRSTLTNPSNGCVPINIFGVGASSPAAIAYVTGRQQTRQVYQQHVVEASVHGDLFSLWAGPVSLATGASYRKERINATSDALSIEGAFGIGNPKPYAGSYDVKEGFAELAIPLAKDMAFAKAFDVSLAARVTDYSTSGRVTTWKAGFNYRPIEDFRLRFTRSRDIRAPSLQELYTSGQQARTSVTDPTKTSTATVNAQQFTGGNPALTPERADTIAIGGVIQPSFLSGFSLSVDYYDIKIKNVISTLTSQQIVDRCFAGNQVLCSQIDRVNGDIINIRIPNLNLSQSRTRGLDFEASYRFPLSRIFSKVNGDAGVRVLANRVLGYSTFDGITRQEFAGDMMSQQPKWTVQTISFANFGDVQLSVLNRFLGAGHVSNLYDAPREIDDNHVASRLYTNVTIDYTKTVFGKKTDFFLHVDNVFNVKPPKGFGWGYGLSASPMYDIIGPMFKFGIRFGI